MWSAVPAISKSFCAPEMMKIMTSAMRPSVNTAFIVYSSPELAGRQYDATRARRLGSRTRAAPTSFLGLRSPTADDGQGSRQRHGSQGHAHSAATAKKQEGSAIRHAESRTAGAPRERRPPAAPVQ